jgi:acetylornithine deacetylase
MIRGCEKEGSHRRKAAGADKPAPGADKPAADKAPADRSAPGAPAGPAGHRADACVVLEPTDLKILTSSRGAVWFRITLKGKPGHSGQAGVTRNAIDMAFRVVEILRGYHQRLLAASRGEALFDKFPNPMPLTIGSLHAGNWPAIAPGEAVLQGVLGLLPNRTAKQVMHEMTSLLAQEGGDLLAGNFDIHFTYRHDASVVPVDHPLVAALQSAARSVGCRTTVDAMTASCDACFYNNLLHVPAVVFGGGSLSVAHSNTEHMPLADLSAAAEVIAALAVSWCGT